MCSNWMSVYVKTKQNKTKQTDKKKKTNKHTNKQKTQRALKYNGRALRLTESNLTSKYFEVRNN